MASFPLTKDPVQKVVKPAKEKMVPMEFPGPADVRLALSSNQVLIFKPGVQLVPQSLVNHPWLKAHKVKLIEGLEGEQAKATAEAQQAQENADDKKKQDDLDKAAKAEADKKRSAAATALNAMTKPELAVFAKQTHGLELNHEEMKKPEMVAAIQNAMAPKKESDAVTAGQ